jgi:copper chaperone NosL
MPIHPAVLLVAVLLLLAACERKPGSETATPKVLTRAAVSIDDGMILLDYPGPKGQLQRRGGETEYFCDTPGLLRAMRDPARANGVAGAFVQAFDGRAWDSYTDGWVPMAAPHYVIGSDRMGAMGPTIVPFVERSAADAFAARHGGEVVTYEALTAERLEAHARMAGEAFRRGGMTGHMSGHGGMSRERTSDAPMPSHTEE